MIDLYSLGAVNGLLLAVLLFWMPKKSGANRVMAIWCMLLSLNFIGNFIYKDQTINVFSFLIGWTYFLPAAYGGLLFLYCQKLLNHATLTLKDGIHFAPLILCYALNIDILLAPSEQKLIYILKLPPQTPSFFISQFILWAQAFAYGAFSIYLVLNYKRKHREQFSYLQKGITNWMSILISLSLLIWLSKLMPSVMQDTSWFSKLGSALIVALIYLVGFMQWLQPQLFATQRLLNISDNLPTLEAKESIEEDSTNQNIKDRLALDAESHALLAKVISDTVETKALYLQENLSLADLSVQTNISVHHISETLNHFVAKSFYRFINEFRVEHFCLQLSLNPTAKITELAMNSGFASKSTFNAAFKELKCITPSQYREQLNKGTTRTNHTS